MNTQAKSPEEPVAAPAIAPAAQTVKTPAEAAPAAQPAAAPIRPVARPAARGRHRRLLHSFIALVLAPALLVTIYMAFIAQDRYASTIGFTVRSGTNDAGAASLLGGLASVAGTSVSGDADILNQFIRSQQMVEAVDAKLDLRRIYAAHWLRDPVFSLWPGAQVEDLTKYWDRVVQVSYDQSSGLIQVEVNAFDPADAQRISAEILAQSQTLVNAINDSAHRDAIRYAQDELSMAETRLKKTRADLIEFRSRTRIVDIKADLESQMGVLADLQRQLSQEQVALKDLLTSTRPNDPRIAQSQRRIDALNARIEAQRNDLASAGIPSDPQAQTPVGYPEAMAQYESLQTDQEFAQKADVAALAALDAARMTAMQQNRYLATFIAPTLSQKAEYPLRLEISALALLFLSLIWGIGALVYYSVREHA